MIMIMLYNDLFISSLYAVTILLLSLPSHPPTLRIVTPIAAPIVAIIHGLALPRPPSSLCWCPMLYGRRGNYLPLPAIRSTSSTLPSLSVHDAMWKERLVLDHMAAWIKQ